MYRLHFGDFAGLASKWFYFILGVMLTMLCVSGMEIWLSKKAHPPLATRLWYSVVWGSVSALALTAVVDMFYAGSLVVIFWSLMVFNTVVTVFLHRLSKALWLMLSGLSVLLLLIAYIGVNGVSSFTISSLQLNVPMLVYVVWSLWRGAVLLSRESNDLSEKSAARFSSAVVSE
jgi:hypothetical protein